MKKVLIVLLIMQSSHFVAQTKKRLNKYDHKIQLYAGGMPDMIWGGFDRYIIGAEASYKHHNFGFNISNGWKIPRNHNNNGFSYDKMVNYYGWRISNKVISTSLNVGAGLVFYREIDYNYYNDGWKNHIKPCLEFSTKTNLTGRANGIAIICSANFTQNHFIAELRLALQLGYEWNDKKTKDPFKN